MAEAAELAAGVRAGIERLGRAFVGPAAPVFQVRRAGGKTESLRYREVYEKGFQTAESAAAAMAARLEGAFATRVKAANAVVWRELPQLAKHKNWAYYARVAFVRLRPGDEVLA